MVSAHAGRRSVESVRRKNQNSGIPHGVSVCCFPGHVNKKLLHLVAPCHEAERRADDLKKSCVTSYFHKKKTWKNAAWRFSCGCTHSQGSGGRTILPGAGEVRIVFQFSKYFHLSRDFQVKHAIRIRLIAFHNILTSRVRKKTVSHMRPF